MADYLRSELLSRLTDEEVRFLTRTSVLERMCGGLCDAVLGRTDSARVLESLERSNRFLVPLDRRRTWYRYHHLFRDLLRSELEQREPGLAPELNRRAMAWCEANGMAEPALHYAHEAGETDAVTHLRAARAADLVRRRRRHVESWLDWYDDELRARYPTIAVLGAWVYFLTGRAAEGERCERAAQASTATPVLPDGSASIEPWIAALRAFTCPDGVERMLADAELALEQLGPEGWWRPTAQLAAGVAHVFLGDAERAGAALGSRPSWRRRPAHRRRGPWPSPSSRCGDRGGRVGAGRDPCRAGGGGGRGGEARRIPRGRARLGRGPRRTPSRRVEAGPRGHRAGPSVRPLLNPGIAWISVQTGLELARVHLALKEPGVAGTVLSEAEHPACPPRFGTLTELAHEVRHAWRRRRPRAASGPSASRPPNSACCPC